MYAIYVMYVNYAIYVMYDMLVVYVIHLMHLRQLAGYQLSCVAPHHRQTARDRHLPEKLSK